MTKIISHITKRANKLAATKPTAKVVAKSNTADKPVDRVKVFNRICDIVNQLGGQVRVEFVKLNGEIRCYTGYVKPAAHAVSSKLSFHLTGDFADARNWRGARLDCITRLATYQKNQWIVANVRDMATAKRNAATAFAAKSEKRSIAQPSNGMPF